MRTSTTNGTWRLARQWSPWRLRRRVRKLDSDVLSDIGDFGDDLVSGVLACIALLVLLLAAGPLLGLAVLGVEALLLLVVLPLAVAGRVLLRRPWALHAKGPGGRRYVRRVAGWRASSRALDEAAESLRRSGVLPAGWQPAR